MASLTALNPRQAALARQRQYDEPLLLAHPALDTLEFALAAAQSGLEVA